jgi:hypothetical protein
VSRYQELRMSWRREVVDDLQERELSLRRKGGLRLIQNVNPDRTSLAGSGIYEEMVTPWLVPTQLPSISISFVPLRHRVL